MPAASKVQSEKTGQGTPDKLYDTLSSFSNQYGGGIIIFGIDEKNDYAVTGVYDPQNLQVYPKSGDKPENDGASVENIIKAFCKSPKSREEIAEHLNMESVYYFASKYLKPMVDAGVLTLTIPEKPKSKFQKYYVKSDV